MIMVGSHDRVLVVLSILVASFASFTALSLASRVRASSGWMRRVWLAAAAVALGGGIWAMHFVAMLAFSMPGMIMTYDASLTVLSLVLAIVFTAGGFVVMGERAASHGRVLGAGLLMGSGVVAMHYVGMAAMRMKATLDYDQVWVCLSVLIALGAATAAVWLSSLEHKLNRQIAAALVMGAAISGMHYTGMRAAVFTASQGVDKAAGVASVTQTLLAFSISGLTLVILVFALGAATLERSFRAYARREARATLRVKIADVLREGGTKEALNEAAALIGHHFQASRTGYAQLDPIEDVFDYEVCWTDGSVPRLLGRFPAADFGVKIVAELAAGRTVVVDDLFKAAVSDEGRTQQTAKEVDTRSILVVPFVRDGRLRTIVYLNSSAPRPWPEDDVRFMEEVAERTRLVAERAAVEEELRVLNATLEARVEARTAELRQAEEARRHADSLYRAYFQHTPDPLFVIGVSEDGSFIIEQVNPAHEAGVGFAAEDVRGRKIEDVLPAETASKVLAVYRRVVETGEILHFRDVFELAGGPRHWDATLVPLRDANVTAQVVAEEALRQSQKMEAMGQLTGGVAHDFNNLLTPILGSLDRLIRKSVGDERDQRLLAGAAEAAERAKTLVQRLLSFARRQPLQPTSVDLSQLVSGMAGLITSTIGPQITLLVEAPKGVAPAYADANQLEMALLNLCVNARDAMPGGGVLRVTVTQERVPDGWDGHLQAGDYLCLSVSDTGVGMDEETLRRAVEPFFSTKGVGQGTGLGLSMAHGLAAQLGGALKISSSLGAGTTVVLWLPRAGMSPRAPEPQQDRMIRRVRRGTALLVDDEELVRASTADMLNELGFAVLEAASGEEALELLDQGLRPDLLVTDHLMPGINGTDLALKALELGTAKQVLVISGYADAEGVNSMLPRLTKPFRQRELASKLAEMESPGENVPGPTAL
jgi:PAS domain S-box-containing protein